jgi:ABC-type glutathione transport system ATPase component
MRPQSAARALGREHELGRVAPGCKADLVLYRKSSMALVPLNVPVRQLVHGETGAGIDTVLVDGEVVMHGGRLTKVDEASLDHQIPVRSMPGCSNAFTPLKPRRSHSSTDLGASICVACASRSHPTSRAACRKLCDRGAALVSSARGHCSLEGIGHAFGPMIALEDVDLSVSAGELIALLGPSGCGKTTMLQIIAGFLRPTRVR